MYDHAIIENSQVLGIKSIGISRAVDVAIIILRKFSVNKNSYILGDCELDQWDSFITDMRLVTQNVPCTEDVIVMASKSPQGMHIH